MVSTQDKHFDFAIRICCPMLLNISYQIELYSNVSVQFFFFCNFTSWIISASVALEKLKCRPQDTCCMWLYSLNEYVSIKVNWNSVEIACSLSLMWSSAWEVQYRSLPLLSPLRVNTPPFLQPQSSYIGRFDSNTPWWASSRLSKVWRCAQNKLYNYSVE